MKNIRFAEILLPSEELFTNYSTEESGEHNVISSMSLVNIFIGANNSGKSRFLRSLFALKDFSYTTHSYTTEIFRKFILTLKNDRKFAGNFSVRDGNGSPISRIDADNVILPDYLDKLLDEIETRFISSQYFGQFRS